MSFNKLKSWADLASLTKGGSVVVEKVRLLDSQIAIEGSFELPQLAQLSSEDQVFIIAFVKSHGSIKEMESIFGLSYPSIKNRLNRISEKLTLVEENPKVTKIDVLKQVERGEISISEALERIKDL